MDLEEFVSETLISIISGVKNAQEKAKELDALVNPAGLMKNTSNISNNSIWDNSNNNYAQPVSFDVAVTAEDTTKTGGKVKVIAGIFGAAGEAVAGNKNNLVSRVQFGVPILLPGHDINKPAARQNESKKRTVPSKGI